MNVLSSTKLSKLILVFMVLWGFTMVAPSLYRMVWPLASFGFSVDNNGVVIDTWEPFSNKTESPAVQAGIAIGDRLDLTRMNCFAPSSPACASLVVVLGGS